MATGVLTLTRTQRRALLVAHVVTSVGWLGASAALLTLSVAAWASDDTTTRQAAYWAEHLLGPLLVLPFSVLSWASGLVLALGTPWGLVRHTWVLAKFVLTTVALALTLFVLLGQIDTAYAHTRPGADGDIGRAGRNLRDAGIASTALYTVVTALSVLKPWGLTRWGRAHRLRGRSVAAGS